MVSPTLWHRALPWLTVRNYKGMLDSIAIQGTYVFLILCAMRTHVCVLSCKGHDGGNPPAFLRDGDLCCLFASFCWLFSFWECRTGALSPRMLVTARWRFRLNTSLAPCLCPTFFLHPRSLHWSHVFASCPKPFDPNLMIGQGGVESRAKTAGRTCT